jgi:hypothetical protein
MPGTRESQLQEWRRDECCYYHHDHHGGENGVVDDADASPDARKNQSDLTARHHSNAEGESVDTFFHDCQSAYLFSDKCRRR